MLTRMASSKAPRKVPTQPRARVTVDAILAATDELAAKGGIESLAMTAIAKRAGVAMGTMYQYFDSLDAVVTAWEERTMAQDTDAYVSFLDELVAEHREMEEAIDAAVSKMIELVRARVRHYRERRRSAEFISRFVERARLVRMGADAVSSRFRSAPDRGRIVVEDLETAAYLLFLSVVSIAYDVAATNAPPDVVERVRGELCAMARRYLLCEGERELPQRTKRRPA